MEKGIIIYQSLWVHIYLRYKLFVKRPENKTLKIETINTLGNRSAVICRKVLEVICYGDDVLSPTLTINDENRKQYYDLLIALYSTERKFLDYQNKKISSVEAARLLEISKSTFLRRYKEYIKSRQ